MKSFFQLSEQARKHQARKLTEAVPPTAPAAGVQPQQQQQQQQQQQVQQPKAVNAPEMNDSSLMQQLSDKWDAFVKDPKNAPALAKLKELEAGKQLGQTLDGIPNQIKALVQSLTQQQKAGSNTAGSAAAVPTAKPAAAPTAAPAAAPTV